MSRRRYRGRRQNRSGMFLVSTVVIVLMLMVSIKCVEKLSRIIKIMFGRCVFNNWGMLSVAATGLSTISANNSSAIFGSMKRYCLSKLFWWVAEYMKLNAGLMAA